jgi:hypothetical protein
MESSSRQEQIKNILLRNRVIAIVGLSKEAEKDSHKVAAYLQRSGYRIIPVNPFVDEVLAEKSYKSLLDIPPEIQKTIEIVDIFRKTADVPTVVDQVIQLRLVWVKPLVVWMQVGIINEEAAQRARQAGIIVVMDRCLMVEYAAFHRAGPISIGGR